jgi:hypothetical protein
VETARPIQAALVSTDFIKSSLPGENTGMCGFPKAAWLRRHV